MAHRFLAPYCTMIGFSSDPSCISDRMVCLRGPIQGLLLCTKPVRWRKPLGLFLRDYALDEPLKEGLHFLSAMVRIRSKIDTYTIHETHTLHSEPNRRGLQF